MLTTQSATPDAVLRPFVHWYVQRQTVSNDGKVVEPVFPRAGTMLIFQFGAIYEVKENETEQLRPSWAATVVGPISSRRTRLILRDDMQSLDVLFRPLGLHRLFGLPIAPLAGGGAEGHAVFGPQASFLYERLGNAKSFVDRVQILDSFFLDRLHRSDPLNPTALALRLLTSGQCGVRATAAKIGISERQLERRCLECAGLSPRLLSRISRFQRAIEKHRTNYGSWMKIAHEVGYYDQMHLIRTFMI